MENIYKPREVAEILRVSYETVLDWIGDATLPAVQLPSGHYRVYEYDVDAAMLPTGRTSARKLPPKTAEVAVWKKEPAPPRKPRCPEFGANTRFQRRYFRSQVTS